MERNILIEIHLCQFKLSTQKAVKSWVKFQACWWRSVVGMQLCFCPQNPRRFKRSHSTLAVIRQTVGEGDCPVFSPFFGTIQRKKLYADRKKTNSKCRRTWKTNLVHGFAECKPSLLILREQLQFAVKRHVQWCSSAVFYRRQWEVSRCDWEWGERNCNVYIEEQLDGHLLTNSVFYDLKAPFHGPCSLVKAWMNPHGLRNSQVQVMG